jgi:internalin A
MRRLLAVGLLGVVSVGCAAEDPNAVCDQPGIVCEIAGNGEAAWNGDGKAPTETSFYLPSSARRGPDGLLYVMDLNNMRLRRVDDTGKVATIAGNGLHLGATDGIAAIDSSLESPVDFGFLADGRVAIVSAHDPRVFAIGSDGMMHLVAGMGLVGALGNEGDRGPAVDARFIELSSVAIADDGTMYLSDRVANRIRKIDTAGIITTFYGTGASAVLKEPEQIILDGEGNLLVADSGNAVVRKITPAGEATIIAGSLSSGFAGDEGPAISAQLASPSGLALTDDGRLFIGDRFNRRVRMVRTDGTITTIAGTGTQGQTGNFGPAIDAEFGYVSRLSLDVDGGLIIADQSNQCIRKVASP